MTGDGGQVAPLVEATALSVQFGAVRVLERVDLTVADGEIVTLIGPNGSGKTTLLRAMLGLLVPSEGSVKIRHGVTIGYVPQQVRTDATLPLDVRRFLTLGGTATASRMATVMAEVGAPGILDHPVAELSGGEMKRVLLARALLRDPDLLVLDEPGAGVDIAGQAELYTLIREIRDRRNCGILLVSHNLHLVMAAADRVVCLNHHICCEGRPEAVRHDPEYLALFGAEAVEALAVYTHRHDHRHDISGEPVPGPPDAPDAGDGRQRHDG